MNSIKQQLYDNCLAYITQKSELITKVMSDSKDAANNETKSTAGDKHETGRASMHLEQETLSGQLAEIDKLFETMQRLKNNLSNSKTITSGSLVIASNGNFYLSVSAGKFEIAGKTYFTISSSSPIGKALMSKKAKDSLVFNGNKITVLEVL